MSLDLTAFEHQAGGWHEGKSTTLFRDKKKHILKPLKLNCNINYSSDDDDQAKQFQENNLSPFCRDELHFYTKIWASSHPTDVKLRALMPDFHGSECVDDVMHLVLGDLTTGMKAPCVMDVKIGFSTNYPRRKPEDKSKVRAVTQGRYGFSLCGLRTYDSQDLKLQTALRPNHCKTLTEEQVFQHLQLFCQTDQSIREKISAKIISGLRTILEWFEVQRQYVVRAGSVLIVYDAALAAANENCAVKTENKRTRNRKSKFTVNKRGFCSIYKNDRFCPCN